MICMMKFIIEISIELCCIQATAYENWNAYTIMDFSALIVLNYVDIYYTLALKDEITQQMAEVGYRLPIFNNSLDPGLQKWYHKIMYGLLWCIEVLYDHFYFHFMPYFGLFFCFYLIDTEWPKPA